MNIYDNERGFFQGVFRETCKAFWGSMEARREFLNKTYDTCARVDLLCRRMSYRPLELS